MKKVFKFIALILCLATITIMALGCSNKEEQHPVMITPQTDNYWGDVPKGKEADDHYWDTDNTPNVNITVIGGDKDLTEKEKLLVKHASVDEDIESMIYEAVASDLTLAGFSVSCGIAYSAETDVYGGLGLYYYDEEFKIFETDQVVACGFVEVLSEDVTFEDPFDQSDNIVIIDAEIIDMETTFAKNAPATDADDVGEDEIMYLCMYSYENVLPYHFVYKNQYITYYQESEMCIKYTIKDNVSANYDLSLGSIYNFDNDTYIYDASIYDEYQTHSGTTLFSEVDYNQLEADLIEQTRIQEQNGYIVEEYAVVYISPEAIQAYIDSQEEATFFGYRVAELEEAFGKGTALVYTENGFVPSEVIHVEDDEYNWKSFLIKMGIGCGIILVGAILSPVTGGASFACALLTITKVAVTYAITSAVVTLAIETVGGLCQGKDIETALADAGRSGLDSFANQFMVGAAMGTVGLLTGVIKPAACFTADTPVITCDGNGNKTFKPISDIQVGESVFAYNEYTQMVSIQTVTAVSCKQAKTLVYIDLGDEIVKTTESHPFYLPIVRKWVQASALCEGSVLLTLSGEQKVVCSVSIQEQGTPVNVYNFTVANDHTYFVGKNSVLVHNECAELLRQQATPAQKQAVADEIRAIRNGTSKNTWPKDLVRKITDKNLTDAQAIKEFSGEFAAHHIIPIKTISELNLDPSLATRAENLVVLLKAEHSMTGSTTAIHQLFGGVGRNGTVRLTGEYFKYLVKLRPNRAADIMRMAGIIGVGL